MADSLKSQTVDLFSVPRIGVGVIIFQDDGKVLVGKRQGSTGAGSFALPGGHLDFGETLEECARRETLEETGLVLGKVVQVTLTESLDINGRHYITIFMAASLSKAVDQKVENREPEKCDGWQWSAWKEIPQPRFVALHSLHSTGWEPSIHCVQ